MMYYLYGVKELTTTQLNIHSILSHYIIRLQSHFFWFSDVIYFITMSKSILQHILIQCVLVTEKELSLIRGGR